MLPNCLLSFLAASLLVLGGSMAEPPAVDTSDGPDWESPPADFVPKTPRSEAEEDRLVAAANFAHARILLQRGDQHEALRRFQRASRYDPNSTEIAYAIAPLASSLGRRDEAARYAILAEERHPRDAQRVLQIGALLVQRNDPTRAVRMFEKALELGKEADSDVISVSLRLEMGRLYFILEQYDKAAESFAFVRQALERPEDFGLSSSQRKQLLRKPGLLYTLMAESSLLAERLDEAAELFGEARQHTADEGLLAYQLARIDAAREDWSKVLHHLEQCFRAKTASAGQKPYELLERVLQETNDDADAANSELLTKLRELHKQDASNGPLANFLAKKLLESGELDASQAIFRGLLDQRPNADLFQGLSSIYRQQNDPQKLLEILGHAVKQTDNLDLLDAELAKITADAELMEGLIQLGRKCLREEPESCGQDQRFALALLAIAAEKYDAAEEFYRAALEAEGRDKTQILETIGLTLYVAGQSERAEPVFRQAIAENPPTEQAAAYHYYLASALAMSKKTEEAVRYARRAAALRTNSARFQGRIPWILYHAKQYDRAEEEYLRLLEKFDDKYDSPGDREALHDARLILSNICVLQDRMPEAEEWLEQVLDEFPEDIGALNDLGYLWADQGKHLHRALRMVRLAVEGDPHNEAYRDSLGWAYFRLGQYQDAVRELERAADVDDPDGIILDHLGDAYLGTKDTDKALATWRRAAEVFRSQKENTYLEKTEAKIKKHTDG